MCIHGIEEKCVQKSERARVKYSFEPTKKKRRRETVCKERDFGEAKSHIFPSLFRKFFSFFFLLEGETKAKKAQKGTMTRKQTKKKFHHQKACACLSSSCVISSSLL